MQLRTIKKPKRKDDDIGYEYQHPQTHKKNQASKATNEKEAHSSNENSNMSNENEAKNKHKLRNSSLNYQGKYKKMNSGKYLYKLNSAEKKPPIAKKKQLKYIQGDFLNQFKKFISHLHMKEEDSLMNKKRKREEGKTKVKQEKARPQARLPHQMPQYSSQGPLNQAQKYPPNVDYMNSYIPQGFVGQEGRCLPQNMNHFMLYINNEPYQMISLNQCVEQKEHFDGRYLEYWIQKQTVNHIVGAFYIAHMQQEMQNKEKRIEYRKTPLIVLNEGDNETIKEPGQNTNEIKQNIFEEKKNDLSIQNQLQPQQNCEQQNKQQETKEQQQQNNFMANTLNNIGVTVEQQLNKVNDVVNCRKENKIQELIEKTST